MLEHLNEKVSKLEFVQESARPTNASTSMARIHEIPNMIEESLREIGLWKQSCTLYQERMKHSITGHDTSFLSSLISGRLLLVLVQLQCLCLYIFSVRLLKHPIWNNLAIGMLSRC
jgi:hypothetical protein